MRELDVLNHLLADPAITAIIADRIWTTWLPEKTVFPAITCNYALDKPINTLSGDTVQSHETITVNLWAKDKPTLFTMINAVKARMASFAPRINMIELNEEEQGIYRYAIDYSVFG